MRLPHRVSPRVTVVGLAAVTGLLIAGCGGGGGASGGGTSGPVVVAPARTARALPSPSTPPRVATILSGRVAPWRLPGPLSRAQAVVVQGRVFVLAGLEPGDRSTARVLGVDVATGRVTTAGSLAVAVHDTAVAVIGGRPVLFAGGNSQEVATVQTFSPASAASAAGSRVVGVLPQARSDLEAAQVDGRVFLLGGYDGITTQAGVLATTDGRSFTEVGRLVRPVRYGAAVTVGPAGARQVLLFGGQRGGVPTDAVQRLDPATGAVTVVARLPRPLSDAVAFSLGGSVWVAGGRVAGTTSDEILRYDLATGRTVVAGRLPYPVADAAVVVVGNAAYLIGGEAAAELDTVTVLRPLPGS
ncbi:MAG: hypothetical protein ACQSGP_20480 [Frankia sp.]